MDRRLYEAAQTGNVQHLHQLLTESPLILHSIALTSAENPLHLACIAGHVEFVKEILRSKPDFAKEVNYPDGLSPMHVASANGHVEIVRELLEVDGNLCRLVEGREKKTPLHYAAVKGRVDVIGEMLLACPECVEDVTVHGETALHLAVKHCQFEAIKVLVEWVREKKMKEDIVNFKDEQGNTILHLTVWRKQRQVIELLLCNKATTSLSMEVNAINHSGLTALDLLMIFPSEAGDREIEEILRGVGAISARDGHNILTPTASFVNQTASRTHSLMQPKNLVDYFKFKKGRDSPSDARNALLVVSVLVATATFQVGLNPPGGVWQDGSLKGQSIMGSNSAVTFLVFMLFNSVGFSVSLFMINILTTNFPMHFELQISTLAMFITYSTAAVTIAPNRIKLYIIIFSSVLPAMVRPVAKGLRQLLWKLRNSYRSSSEC